MKNSYQEHLKKDKKLAKFLDSHPSFTLKRDKNICLSLCSSIMSQQLSIKVAEVIYKRFLALYDNGEPTPQQILDTPASTLRSIGLSNAKVSYVHNTARFAIEKGMEWSKLKDMPSEELIEYLTQIKGVGRWTVEMLLMFTLGREDVFSPGDLGIQNAMISIYRLNPDDRKTLREKMLKISSKWQPYRTYACLHLWHYNSVLAKVNGKGS